MLMTSATATVPLRCPACGEQTHKTLECVVEEHGLLCQCGVRSELDFEQFAVEIRKLEANIRGYGRNG